MASPSVWASFQEHPDPLKDSCLNISAARAQEKKHQDSHLWMPSQDLLNQQVCPAGAARFPQTWSLVQPSLCSDLSTASVLVCCAPFSTLSWWRAGKVTLHRIPLPTESSDSSHHTPKKNPFPLGWPRRFPRVCPFLP